MPAIDHATQAEIRLANMYALHCEAERGYEVQNWSSASGDRVAHLEAMWSRKDRYIDSLWMLASDLDLDLGLIFDVAREIRESETVQ